MRKHAFPPQRKRPLRNMLQQLDEAERKTMLLGNMFCLVWERNMRWEKIKKNKKKETDKHGVETVDKVG